MWQWEGCSCLGESYRCVWQRLKVRVCVTQRESHYTSCCEWWLLCCWSEKLPAGTSEERPHKHTCCCACWRCCYGWEPLRTEIKYLNLFSPLLLSSQLNETAKQLMEIDKPTPTNAPGPSSEPAPLGPCVPGPSPCSSPSNGNGSGHRRGEGKKNAKKRHSFSALSVSQRAAQLNNRHSMEISHPVLISSSDPRAAARIQVHTNTRIHTFTAVSIT